MASMEFFDLKYIMGQHFLKHEFSINEIFFVRSHLMNDKNSMDFVITKFLCHMVAFDYVDFVYIRASNRNDFYWLVVFVL